MASVFDSLKNIHPGRQTWRLKVRVERMWEMFPLDEPSKPFSIEMVLLDAEYAKVKRFRGVVVLQNVLNTTHILWNPDISEVVEFRHSIVSRGVDICGPLETIEDHTASASSGEEFLHMYPRKSISELNNTEDDGLFIILATIVTVLTDNNWWYSVCKCNRAVIVDGDSYYCPNCTCTATDVTLRYKLKVEVFDGDDTTAFVMFDSDAELVTGVSCFVLLDVYKESGIDQIPPELEDLGGKELLFKVEKADDYAFKYDDTFKVKRVYIVSEIIGHYTDMKKISTPKVNKFHILFPSLDDIPEDVADGKRGVDNRAADNDDGGSHFSVADYLSDQAGCPIDTPVDATNEASSSRMVKERGKGNK
ncbi:hypothetical protein SESBI_44584 [Sesbania bispinosa]|nr:hypothetical protein SESBI_44584 [Sesbania bispinosa]